MDRGNLPLTMAHSSGWLQGRENSIEGLQAALSFNADIIEIDVRKSRDGVLYCHHGLIPFGVFAAQFFRFINFKTIKQLVGERETLADMLAIIPEHVDIYLDVKSRRISAEDLKPHVSIKNTVWVSAYRIWQLKKLRKGLGEDFIYAYNRPFILKTTDIPRLVGVADIVHLLKWQWKQKTIDEIESKGIACRLAHWFLTFKEYQDWSRNLSPWKGVCLGYDDLSAMQRSEGKLLADTISVQG